ncbi:LemA family protein [Acinetobacter sp. B51(2017)]|uniref:LemA family protein n=1 Tax=Acinetobacter sp. B51(2017) TaxID=2060938 RepID=UPI000F0966B9|nr:LemA family protein [Acinetobacter sp. B51(2017)]
MQLMIFLGLVILFIMTVIIIRNNIVRYHNASIRAWADVASFERQKVKILEGLAPVLAEYSQFEQGTLAQVTELRQNVVQLKTDSTDIGRLQQIEALSKQFMQHLNVVVENYPELKANQIYLKMMQEIEEQNENVGAAITIFNRNVEVFNNYIQIFPNNLINTATTGKKPIRVFRDASTTQNFDYRPNF